MGLRVTALLIALCFVSTGCGFFSGTKHATEELVWPEEVELEQESGLDPAEKRMAGIVYPVDTRLQSLIQAVTIIEPSSEGELADLVSKFSWIVGAEYTLSSSTIAMRFPWYFPVKRSNFLAPTGSKDRDT